MRTPALPLLLAALSLAPRPAAGGERPGDLTILSYHEVADPADALVPAYAVTPTHFVRQMDWLRNHGYRFVSAGEVIAAWQGGPALPERAVLVTFDDGYHSVYENAWPILKAFKVPAVIAVVGSWLEETATVDFDGKPLPRQRLISWDDLGEMTRDGLVEVGSHGYDIHRGLLGNPQGNLQPAAIARRWIPEAKRYEEEGARLRRVRADLVRNRDLIRRRLGRAPRVMSWPYGRYDARIREIAVELGMPVGLTLDDGTNRAGAPLWGLRRILVERDMSLLDLEREIAIRRQDLTDNDRPQKILHVDLDYVYDEDAEQQERNLGHLLDRIAAMGVNSVYLQAFADPDGNGSADAVYFPNRHLPVRADLFNRVAWQIRTRTPVKRLYAWMPMLSWELPAGHPAAGDRVVTLPGETSGRVSMGYRRLSPFSARVRQVVREVYEDLARAVPFDGLLFHDDVTLSDYEDASPFALAQYRAWGLPGAVEEIRRSDDLLGRWTILKINALDDMAMELAELVRERQPALKVARNLYARVATNPKAEVWYSQALENSVARYDFTAIMAMPYMERAPEPRAFYRELVEAVKQRPGAMRRVVFELQAVDWSRGNRPIPSRELAETIRSLYGLGVQHLGYYPDVSLEGHPDPGTMKPAFDAKPNAPEPR